MSRSVSRLCIVSLFLCLVFIQSPAAFAQAVAPEVSSTLTGSVADRSGLPLSGADVRLSGPVLKQALTDAHGQFIFSNIPAGLYSLHVQKASFASAEGSEIAVLPGARQNVSIVLEALTFSSLKVIGSVHSAGRANSINTSTAAISDIVASTFLDQGSPQVTQVLNETPGIVTTVSAFPANGNSDGGSMATQQVPQIRGALPYETESLIDGHPVSVGANGYFTPLYVNPHMLDDVEIVKGPGAAPPDINYAVGGSINYRTLEPTRVSHAAIDLYRDGYGGVSTNLKVTGTVHHRLGFAVAYGINGSPGPLNHFSAHGIPGDLIGSNATINGQPICGDPNLGSSCLLGVGPGQPNVYGSFQLLSPINLCCYDVSTQYLARTELAKLQYSFSEQTGLTVAFLGAQSHQSGDQTSAFDGTIFAPPSGYSGSIPANTTLPFGLDTYSPVQFDQTQGLLESELRTALGRNTLLLRYYTGANNSDQHQFPFGTTYNFNAQTWGALPIGPGGSNVYFNGQREAYSSTGAGYSFPTQDHFGGLSAQLDIPSHDNLYTFSVDRTTHNSYAAQFFEIAALNNVTIPHGSSQAFTTLLARADLQLGRKVEAVVANYFISYNSHYTPDGGATWHDAAHSFYGPRLGLTWRPNANTVVRGALGSSIAPPYLALITTQSGSPLPDNYGAPHFYTEVINNGKIDPETSFGYDLGIDRRLHSDTVLSGDIYLTSLHGQFLNSVSTNGTYTAPSGPNAGITLPLYVSQARNLGSSRYEGVELSIHKTPAAGMGYRVQGSLQRAYAFNLPPGFYDTGAGPNTTNLAVLPNVNFQPGGNGFNGVSNGRIPYAMGYGELNYASRFAYYRLGVTYYGPNNTYNQLPFGVFSASARWKLAPSTSVQLSAYNLAATHSEPYFNLMNGIPVPLVNGMLGPTAAINVGPPTIGITLHHEIGAP